MLIKDLNRTSYELTKTRLSELPKGDHSRYVILTEILQTPPGDYASLEFYTYGVTPVRYRTLSGEFPANEKSIAPTYLKNYTPDSIGCRTFSTANHNKILKAAKGAK